MARKTEEEKLEQLQARKKKLEAQIQKKNSAIKLKQRKQDTRRKIIVGALALEHMQHDADFNKTVKRLIDENVTREEDKKLFEGI